MPATDIPTPTERDRDYAKSRGDHAYWYAVGHSDGTGDVDVAHEFSIHVREAALAYRLERRTSLPSIPDAFLGFIAAEKVRAVYSRVAEDLSPEGRRDLANAVKALEDLRG